MLPDWSASGRARAPILMFNLGVPKEFTFRATSRVSFCTFGVILEVIFGPREHFRGAVGSFLRPKTAGGTKGGPRAAKEAPPPKYCHPFGDLLELFFHIFRIFY